MFHFPTFPPHALCVQARVTGFKALPGFPIRKSSDHSSVDSSPRHIAASHVLHRLLVPRHPPCALNNLATKIKMLASTVQFSNYERKPAAPAGPTTTRQRYPTTNQPAHPPHQPQASREGPYTRASHSLKTQQRTDPPDPTHPQEHTGTRDQTRPNRTSQRSTHEHTRPTIRLTLALDQAIPHYRRHPARKLLRKEVIQPHLPVRLPCYDFVPIAGPTFDGSPHKGWATGFGCYRLS